MASNDKPPLPPVSPEHRRIAAERFSRANQVIGDSNFDYGIQLLLTCCRLDPANFLYRQTLRRTQKQKFGNNLRGSRLAFLTTFRKRAWLKAARTSGDHLKVLEYGEEILSRNPWDLGVQMDMAEACDTLGLLDMAIFQLDQARQKYPNNPTLNRALARLFEKRGNFVHAITLWQLVKEVVPSDLEAAHKAKDLAASETIQRGQYESGEKPALGATATNATTTANKSEKPVDRVKRDTSAILTRIEANPTDPNLYIQLAGVYRRFNQLDRARAALEQGLGPTGSHFQLTVELLEMDIEPLRKNLQLAEEKIRQRGKADDSNDMDEDDEAAAVNDLFKIRTRLLSEINSRELELFRLRADRFPQDLSYRLELGYRLLRAGQIDQSIAELQLVRKDPKLAGRASMYLGFCFQNRNNWRLAQRNFEEALNLLPETDEANRKEVLFQLAHGLAEAGDLAKAIDLGHELANLDYSYKDIGKLLDEWHERLQQA
jgi:tetratricopeptide (TPR) repeat protein